MCLINYLGWRVICVSLLPISSKTLVYGSADGGRTVHNSNETMNNIMKQMGKMLNLKEHTVKSVAMHGPADIEGHKGSDGRFYIADVSRLFPPCYLHKRYIFFTFYKSYLDLKKLLAVFGSVYSDQNLSKTIQKRYLLMRNFCFAFYN
jgi:hypothetical protein